MQDTHAGERGREERQAYEDRILELSRRLADKQREVDVAHARVAGITATRGWRVVTALSLGYRLLLLQPEAYHRLASFIRRLGARIVRAVRVRLRPRGGHPNAPDNGTLYQEWRVVNEPDASQLSAQRRTSRSWPNAPLISIVVPVFAPPADALADCIASVQRQTYERWQLVLVIAGPQPDAVTEAVRAAEADSRVHAVSLERNLGIAANTNAGIDQARGDYIAFLDHDDLLSPEMLYEVVRLLRLDPALDMVTFDEDKMAADGVTRQDPIFKPSMTSPEHLLSFNDRMHSVVKRSCIERVGGVAAGVDGAQDWDLGLRLLEAGARTRHIPRVLYHWRMVPGSAAGDALAKPWAFDAQRVALATHLERLGRTAPTVDHPQIGVVRVRWAPSGDRVSIIIPTRDRAGLLETCLRSIREKTSYQNYEIIVIDTGSQEDATRQLYERLAADTTIRILFDEAPFNFSRVNNLGAREATGQVLVFLNNDIEVIGPDWLDELVMWVDVPDVGCVGPKLLYPDGTLQHAGIVAGMEGHGSHVYQGGPGDHTWGVFGSVDFYRNYLMLGGACLAIRRSLFDQLAGFDEAYTLCYSDLDLCLKAADAGFRNVYTPFARLYHHEGATRGRHFPPGDVMRASVAMYPVVIQGDPFYNPNLSYRHRMPTIVSEDNPAARDELLRHIAAVFNIREPMKQALLDEVMGRTSHWSGYRRLIRAAHPPAPARPTAPGCWRLLFVTHDLSRSGAPMVVLHLARALGRLGHAVTVLSPKDGRLRHDLEEAGADVIVSPLALEAPYALAEVLEAFDAILPNTVLAWKVVLAAAAAQKPVVWLIHESLFGLASVRQETGAIQALAIADEVVFPSKAALRVYREFDAGNMSAEIYGIDQPQMDAPATTLDPASFHFVAMGSLEPRKGQDVLVSAFRRLPRQVRDKATLHLLGRPLDAAFVDILRRIPTSFNIVLHGEVSPAEALSYVAAADALVCASRDETGPLVVMEAMALAKPIVSTPVGAVPEMVTDGVSALLVPVDDATALMEAMSRVAGDQDLRQRLGRAARAGFEEHLGNARYGAAMAARLSRAIARRRPASPDRRDAFDPSMDSGSPRAASRGDRLRPGDAAHDGASNRRELR